MVTSLHKDSAVCCSDFQRRKMGPVWGDMAGTDASLRSSFTGTVHTALSGRAFLLPTPLLFTVSLALSAGDSECWPLPCSQLISLLCRAHFLSHWCEGRLQPAGSDSLFLALLASFRSSSLLCLLSPGLGRTVTTPPYSSLSGEPVATSLGQSCKQAQQGVSPVSGQGHGLLLEGSASGSLE